MLKGIVFFQRLCLAQVITILSQRYFCDVITVLWNKYIGRYHFFLSEAWFRRYMTLSQHYILVHCSLSYYYKSACSQLKRQVRRGIFFSYFQEVFFAFSCYVSPRDLEELYDVYVYVCWKQVSDVVPVACRAAADAGLPSVCITNFRFSCLTPFLLHIFFGLFLGEMECV